MRAPRRACGRRCRACGAFPAAAAAAAAAAPPPGLPPAAAALSHPRFPSPSPRRTSCSPTTARCSLPTRATARRRSSAVTRAARCRSRTGDCAFWRRRRARRRTVIVPRLFSRGCGLKKWAAASSFSFSPARRRSQSDSLLLARAVRPSSCACLGVVGAVRPRSSLLAAPRPLRRRALPCEKALTSAGRSTLSSVSRPVHAGAARAARRLLAGGRRAPRAPAARAQACAVSNKPAPARRGSRLAPPSFRG